MSRERYGLLCLVHDEDNFGIWAIPVIEPVVKPKSRQVRREGKRRIRSNGLEKEILEVLNRLSAIFRNDPQLSQMTEINLSKRGLAREWLCAPQQVEPIVFGCFAMLKRYWQKKLNDKDVVFADQVEMVLRVRNICHDFSVSTFEELIQLAKELDQSKDPVSLDGL